MLKTPTGAVASALLASQNGQTWPEEVALPPERRALYQALLRQIGVSRITGGAATRSVAFHFDLPLQIPDGPVKSFVYAETPPSVLTSGSTSRYVFTPGQYRRVCRPIESFWYVCLDKET